MTQLPVLDNLKVAAPCSADWNKMRGNDRVRHCASCNLNVYNFAEMTRAEIAALVAEKEGERLCGRMYRRADGTLLTKDCPVGLRARIKRTTRRAGLVLTALLGLGINAVAQSEAICGSTDNECKTQGGTTIAKVVSREGEDGKRRAAVNGTVYDLNEAVVVNAKLTLTSLDTGKVLTVYTDDKGIFTISDLSHGNYQLEVSAPGFRILRIKQLWISDDNAVNLKLTLDVGETMGIVVTEPAVINDSPTNNIQTVLPMRQVEDLPTQQKPFIGLILNNNNSNSQLKAQQKPEKN